MTLNDLTLYHNPNCSTSRKVLGMLRERGLEPTVVEYLKVGWTRETLERLLVAMGAGPRAILRTKEGLAKEMDLAAAGVSDETILLAMIAHPVLVERPIVAGPKGTAVCRPVESVEGLI